MGICLYAPQNGIVRRGVVGETPGYAGDQKIVGVARGFDVVQIAVQAAGKPTVGIRLIVLADIHVRKGSVRRVLGQPQHVAEVIVLAVPAEKPPPVPGLPKEGGLILIQRVKPVTGVDIHVQKLNADVQKRVALPERDAVDVGAHGTAQSDILARKRGGHLTQAAQKCPVVREVAEIEIRTG